MENRGVKLSPTRDLSTRNIMADLSWVKANNDVDQFYNWKLSSIKKKQQLAQDHRDGWNLVMTLARKPPAETRFLNALNFFNSLQQI